MIETLVKKIEELCAEYEKKCFPLKGKGTLVHIYNSSIDDKTDFSDIALTLLIDNERLTIHNEKEKKQYVSANPSIDQKSIKAILEGIESFFQTGSWTDYFLLGLPSGNNIEIKSFLSLNDMSLWEEEIEENGENGENYKQAFLKVLSDFISPNSPIDKENIFTLSDEDKEAIGKYYLSLDEYVQNVFDSLPNKTGDFFHDYYSAHKNVLEKAGEQIRKAFNSPAMLIQKNQLSQQINKTLQSFDDGMKEIRKNLNKNIASKLQPALEALNNTKIEIKDFNDEFKANPQKYTAEYAQVMERKAEETIFQLKTHNEALKVAKEQLSVLKEVQKTATEEAKKGDQRAASSTKESTFMRKLGIFSLIVTIIPIFMSSSINTYEFIRTHFKAEALPIYQPGYDYAIEEPVYAIQKNHDIEKLEIVMDQHNNEAMERMEKRGEIVELDPKETLMIISKTDSDITFERVKDGKEYIINKEQLESNLNPK